MNTKPYKSPKHKLICLFEKSRNMWKERAQGYFRKNRAFQVRVRDLEASRDHWRELYFSQRSRTQASAKHPSYELVPRRCDYPPGINIAAEPPDQSKFQGCEATWSVIQDDGSSMNWELLAPQEASPRTSSASELQIAPRGHRYTTEAIRLAVELVLWCNVSLRAAARIFSVMHQQATPAFETIRHWILRLGLYELQRVKEHATDWVFIVDATIGVGEHKALVILGARLGQLAQQGFNLKHQDVVVLGLKILTRCDGVSVHAQIKEAADKVGVPRSVVSDGGGDVKKGVKLFQKEHSHVVWNYDLTHRLARLLEKQLKNALWWERFLKLVGKCRNEIRQTRWSFLLPPAQRTKARWFNLDPLIGWALGVLAYGRGEGLRDEKFGDQFGWLAQFETSLQETQQMTEMIKAVCEIIKEKGVNAQHVQLCQKRIEEIALSSEAKGFGAQILEFLGEQAALAKPGETLLGSSDVIESLFGKYKSVVERSPLKAITEMVLTVAALTSARTSAVIKSAMEMVGVEDVRDWFTANGTLTLLSKRKAAIGSDDVQSGTSTA